MILDIAREISPDGELLERVAMLVRGKVVQIVRYNRDNNSVLACVGLHMTQIPLSKVHRWIVARL